MKKYVIPGLIGFGGTVGALGVLIGLVLLGSWIDDHTPKWLAAWIIFGFPLGIFGAIGAISVNLDDDKKKAELG